MGNIWFSGLDREIWYSSLITKTLYVSTGRNMGDAILVSNVHDIVGKHSCERYAFQNPDARVDAHAEEKPDPSNNHLKNSIAYDSELVSRVAKVITTVIGGLFPVISIVVLYATKDMATRLGVLVVVTVAFSLCLSLATRESNRSDSVLRRRKSSRLGLL